MAKPKQPASSTKSRMSDASWFDKLSPARRNIICVAILYLLVVLLFRDIVFNNMIFSEAGDNAAHEAWSRAMQHIGETDKTEPLWIPYIFSGMPVAGAMLFPRGVNFLQDQIVGILSRVLFLGAQLHWMIMPYLLMGVSMFFFARMMKFSHMASLIAAITMMLNPYGVGLPETGHGSKLIVLGYIPLLFLLTYNLFQKRNILSLGFLAAVVGTMLLNRHPQMAFYGLLIIGCYFVYEIALDARERNAAAVKKTILFVAALLIGFAMFAYHYFPTQEYAQYSIRGSEGEITGGLSYDYATNWSFHPFELIEYIIPGFFGISAANGITYWGWMPFTNSAVYVGIVPLLLGIFALFYRRNRMTWFLALFSLFVFLISFGKYFPLLYNLLFNYLPYFNKFRTPVMIVHLIPLTFGILAAYGFSWLTEVVNLAREPELVKLKKVLSGVLIAVGALLVIGFIFNEGLYSALSGSMFQKDTDLAELRQQYGAQAMQVLPQLQRLRFDLLWKDYIKFAFVSGAALSLVILYLRKKVRPIGLAAGLILITIIDLWIMDVGYINPRPANAMTEHFQSDQTMQALEAESATSLFRVLPVGDLDKENRMMYHSIQSLEGYCPAKLKIYQEVRDSCFNRSNRNVFNMLNAKYFVGRQKTRDGSVETATQLNPDCLPRAWFIDSVVVLKTKGSIFALLNDPRWNPRTTAILEKEPAGGVSRSDSSVVDVPRSGYSSRTISLTTRNSKQSLLVLSEVYYPAGWKAFIDGSETEIYKTNYILRSIVVPAGSHGVEFRFDSPVYSRAYTASLLAWGFTCVLILIGVFRVPAVRARIFPKKPPKSDAPGPTTPG